MLRKVRKIVKNFKRPRYVRPAIRKAVKNYVQRTREIKELLAASSDASIDQGGVIQHLSTIAQSDLASGREGNRVMGKQLQFRCSLTNADAGQTTGANTKIRVILFKDKQQNATAPTIAQLLLDNTVGDQFINSPYNTLQYPRKFKIYYDRTHTINSSSVSVPAATAGTSAAGAPYIQKKHFSVFRKIPGWISYTGSASSAVSNGNLYVAFITDQDEQGAFNYSSNITYYDS
jgi:hypothetical protein